MIKPRIPALQKLSMVFTSDQEAIQFNFDSPEDLRKEEWLDPAELHAGINPREATPNHDQSSAAKHLSNLTWKISCRQITMPICKQGRRSDSPRITIIKVSKSLSLSPLTLPNPVIRRRGAASELFPYHAAQENPSRFPVGVDVHNCSTSMEPH